MDPQIRVLVVDDDEPHAEAVAESLERVGYECVVAGTGREGLRLIEEQDFDIVLTDLIMDDVGGMDVLAKAKQELPDAEVVILTGHNTAKAAVLAMQAGATTYLTKPLDIVELRTVADKVSQSQRLARSNLALQKQLNERFGFEGVIGNSPLMHSVVERLRQIAPTSATVLITGESGTGKEVVAREIHNRSKRKNGPFIAINCAAVPEQLLESELFGHAKGAFTDAKTSRQGLFQQASGGTLFLDEIGEMALALQPKLLRSLQERKVRPVGAESEVSIDVRLVCATNRELEEMVEAKAFREDLYYRINVIHTPLPPLRARGGDVLLLAQHWLRHYAAVFDKKVVGLTAAAAERMMAYDWPGNVRELGNCLERAVALAHFEEIQVEDLPEKIRSQQPRRSNTLSGSDVPELLTLEEVERRHVIRVLEACHGNRTDAAKILGLDRKTLYRKLLRWGVGDE